jgi:hypothetical protein
MLTKESHTNSSKGPSEIISIWTPFDTYSVDMDTYTAKLKQDTANMRVWWRTTPVCVNNVYVERRDIISLSVKN